MFAMGNDELDALPDFSGTTITCRRCGQVHAVSWGKVRQDDGTWEEMTGEFGSVRCKGLVVLAVIEGKRLQLPGGV